MSSNKIFSNVFKWMSIGLLVSFATAYFVSLNETMLFNIYSTGTYWFIIILELALVIVLSALINKMSYLVALVCYLLYCFVSGLTMSSICYVYELGSIFIAFLVTAGMFGAMAFLGDKTKKDLSKLGTILLFALIPIIIVSIVNIFIGNTLLDLILSVAIILIFCGVTAYDVQKIKRLSVMGYDEKKLGLIGALDLYLDFINIFEKKNSRKTIFYLFFKTLNLSICKVYKKACINIK